MGLLDRISFKQAVSAPPDSIDVTAKGELHVVWPGGREVLIPAMSLRDQCPCAACVEEVLHDVCPNCGGGFAPRPIRPSRNWKGDNYLGKHPASKHRPVDPAAHARFSAAIRNIPPEKR